ncbi:MAG TPA: class I SAM-dependent methyltransferase [Cyclobacteriaceae bacterium]|jgi:SAM-dependent methyltransferase
MPTSHSGQINTIVDLLTIINPKKLLDIGVGHGKYGFLAREYLDISDNSKPYSTRTVQIDGIEAFPEYITDLQRLIYDTIHIGNALDVIDKVDNYDLILMMDVFEHFTYEDGMALLNKCLKHSKHVLISCPRNVEPQGAEYGNIYETHRFEWRKKHFRSYKEKAFIPNYYSLICLLGPGAKQVRRKFLGDNMKLRIGSMFPRIRRLYIRMKG